MTTPLAAGRRLRLPALTWPGRRHPLAQVAVAVLAGAVGFLLVGQVRTSSRVTRRLSAESEGDLARILSGLTADADNLQDQVGTLKLQLFALQTSSSRDETATRTAQDQLSALQILAGTVPASGPGVLVTVSDPEGAVGYDTVIGLVQELRDAGAEALSIDDQRIGATSSFAPGNRGVTLSGPGAVALALAAPFRVVALGDPATLDAALAIPGGAVDTLRAQRGVQVTVERQARTRVPALAAPPSYRVAVPVGSGP